MCNTILGPQTPISPDQYLITRNKRFLSCLHRHNFKILAKGWVTHTKSVLPKCGTMCCYQLQDIPLDLSHPITGSLASQYVTSSVIGGGPICSVKMLRSTALCNKAAKAKQYKKNGLKILKNNLTIHY